MNNDKQIISDLVEKVQQGDMDAFGKLYELMSPRSLFVALEIVKNKQDAEDILQESFITALEKINTLDKSESFVGWFNRIVANKSKDFLKKKKPVLFDEEEKQVFELIPDEDKEFSPQDNFNDSEMRKMVLDAVNELSDEKRICVLLHYYNEMSIADIAETVGSNENTVKSRLFQARKDLSAKFKELERKGLYSVSPIGLVLWAWKNTEKTVTKNFVGSKEAATILSSVTSKASISTAAGVATATTASVGTATVSASVTGAGLAAKVAALTAVQKIAAGIAIAGVVTGSAAGTAIVVKNSNAKEEAASIVYTEESKVVTSSGIWEIEETDTESLTSETTRKTEVPENADVKEMSSIHTQKETEKTTKKDTEVSTTQKKTKSTTTRRDYSLYTSATTSATTTTSTTLPTTEETTTRRRRTTTTTERTTEETTRETTKKPTTTEEEILISETTSATTVAKAKLTVVVRDAYSNIVAQETFDVDGGTLIDRSYTYNILSNGVDGKTYLKGEVLMINLAADGYEIQPGEEFTLMWIYIRRFI